VLETGASEPRNMTMFRGSVEKILGKLGKSIPQHFDNKFRRSLGVVVKARDLCCEKPGGPR